jgi:DNA-directed RNA polymerase subunit omega
LNNTYVEKALEVISDKNILVNLASKRASELSRGSKPLVKVPAGTTSLDTALLEIAEGKVNYEIPAEK